MTAEEKFKDVFDALKKAPKGTYVPVAIVAATARCGKQFAKSALLAAEKEGLVETVPVIVASIVGSGAAPTKAYRLKENA